MSKVKSKESLMFKVNTSINPNYSIFRLVKVSIVLETYVKLILSRVNIRSSGKVTTVSTGVS